jgi:hypothetical protein
LQKHLGAFTDTVQPPAKENLPPKKKKKQNKNNPHFHLAEELQRITGVDLTRIDGVDVIVAQTVISEVGLDMTRWKTESALVRSLEGDSLLMDRVERLMTIPAVGPITALTWALEVGEVQRFSSIKKAISYCGLCGAERSSGSTVQHTPLSKQRNKHLQTTLIEAAKMAPRNSPELAMLYDKEKQKGNANRATLAVARKLVAYWVAVDRRQKEFLTVERENRTAA